MSSDVSCEEKSASNDFILKFSIFEASMSKAFFAFHKMLLFLTKERRKNLYKYQKYNLKTSAVL